MYTYRGKIINNPICIHFLCGNKYSHNDVCDKRNVLLDYINSIDYNYTLILEKVFTFRDYKKMNIKDLGEAELMASHYASSIIILHETNSTAAEISFFASHTDLYNKMLVINPHRSIIEVNNIGAFINHSFIIPKKFVFKSYKGFGVKFNDELEHVRFYDTFFINNEISDDLKYIIRGFIEQRHTSIDLLFRKKTNIIKTNYYIVRRKEKTIKIVIAYNFVFSMILAIISNKKLRSSFKDFDDCIEKVCVLVKKILLNTISYYEKVDSSKFHSTIQLDDSNNTNIAVRFCLNILQGIDFLKFVNGKLVFSRKIEQELSNYYDLIEIKKDNFFFDSLYLEGGDKNE